MPIDSRVVASTLATLLLAACPALDLDSHRPADGERLPDSLAPDGPGDPIVEPAGDGGECRARGFSFPALGCEPTTEPLAATSCPSALEGAEWVDYTTDHFVFHYFPGTQAESDIDRIAAARETAYSSIRTRLGITEEPRLEVYLSPNRVVAADRGLGMGTTYFGWDRMDVIYTGLAGSYEVERYGHELTHALAYYLDPDHPRRLTILSEGLAEVLDQSGRDPHAAYAANLAAGTELRTRVASFDSNDVWGNNYGRGGSLVWLLVTRLGWDQFLELYEQAYVTWSGGCYRHPSYGCIDSATAIETMLDGLLSSMGDSWADVHSAWKARVELALDSVAPASDGDFRDIANVVRVMDDAIGANDVAAYRSTMESFYCDWGGEDKRLDIAARAVQAFGRVESRLVAVHPSGTKNFPTAIAVVLRRDERGTTHAFDLYFEKTGSGWRSTWGPDWY